jgi:nucleoside-diphosphate-sugar epimerase
MGYKVVILKRSFSNVSRIKAFINHKNLTIYDIDKIELNSIEWNDVDVIVHCATEYGRSNASCYKVLETNLMFPIRLLECAVKNNVKTFINTDSYFDKENMSYSNLLNYSLSKKSLKLWLKNFSKDIKIINLILEHVYGENDNSNKFVERMIQDIAINPLTEINLSPGDQKRDFIYVDNVCEAFIEAIEFSFKNNFRYRDFNIGTGKLTTLKDFLQIICQCSPHPKVPVLNWGAIPYRNDEIMSSVADSVELSSLIDAKNFITPKEGIEKIINYYLVGENYVNKR